LNANWATVTHLNAHRAKVGASMMFLEQQNNNATNWIHADVAFGAHRADWNMHRAFSKHIKKEGDNFSDFGAQASELQRPI
jgi:hypothetical protein